MHTRQDSLFGNFASEDFGQALQATSEGDMAELKGGDAGARYMYTATAVYNYRLVIAYKGTRYKGWQKTALGIPNSAKNFEFGKASAQNLNSAATPKQPNLNKLDDAGGFKGWDADTAQFKAFGRVRYNSIEEMLERSLFQILRKRPPLQAASRTDAGVHAEGQVVNFILDAPLNPPKFLHGLNGTLPPDIRVLSVELAPENFHPTTDATGKHYAYTICNQPVQLPFYRDLSWHFPYPLCIDSMQLAAQHLLGTHDFSAFCNERSLWTRNPICTLDSIHFSVDNNQHLVISIRGDHFLYKMVRNLAGTLAYVGCGKIPSHTIPMILANKARALAGVTAPAHGLTLKQIMYKIY